ncbi:MAG: periplasmic heavy metal sensor [Caulobacterales bacterium]|nr:periplasmic heavy metal sensor [Caulobacterales bacterium]
MKPGLRNLLITVILAVLAAGGGAWICAYYVISHQSAGPSLHDMVHRDLNLTPEQSRKLDAIEDRYAVERKALEADVRAANHELADAIRDGHKDSPKVEAAIDHLHMAMGALQKATIAHVFDMRAVLTQQQARAFDAEVIAALTQEDR